jgi:hypothetical protein
MLTIKIPGHPVIMIFDRQGQEVKRFIGPQPVEAIEEILLVILED